tara:strand:- start:31 stop:771 length:741 start_codon:yes stop_codon:yes gene_type:complete
MADRKAKRAKEQAARLEARVTLGKAFKRWRVMNNISQQNLHEWAKAEGVNLFNSQLAYFELSRLDPKNEFWYSLETGIYCIANNQFPPTQGAFSRTVLDRLKQAEPFLNIEGEPATAQDLQAMFGARQRINPLYTKQEKLTKEFLTDYVEELEKTFKQVAKNNMMSNKECWDSLTKTAPMKAVKEKHVTSMAQDILRGERVPTLEEAKFILLKYKGCPACVGLREVSEDPLSKKIEDMHAKLLSFV